MGSPAMDLTALGRSLSATLVSGPSREVVNRCAWAMARANDPTPFYLDIRAEDGRADVGSPSELGWVNPDQLFVVAPGEARPHPPVGARTIASVIRADDPHVTVAELSDFLQMPAAVQEMIGLHSGGIGRPAFVIANCDRVATYYPTAPQIIRRVLEVFLRRGVLPVFTTINTPGTRKDAFEFAFEVTPAHRSGWRSGRLVCERAPHDAPFKVGDAVPLEDMPVLADALQGRSAPRTTFL